MRLNKRAITRLQGTVIIAILVVLVAVGAYYSTLPPAAPGPTTTAATTPLTTQVSKGKLVVDLWYESSGHYPQSAEQALLIKAQLERTGVITVNLHGADWASFKKNRDAEIMPLYLVGAYPDYMDADGMVMFFLHSKGAAGWLRTNYKNPEMDRLIEQARASIDPAIRDQLYAQIQKIMVDDAPYVPIYQSVAFAVSKTDVEGIVLDLTQVPHLFLMDNPRDTLFIGTTDSVEINLDPAEAWDYFGFNTIIQNTGESLLYIEPGSEAGPEDFRPALATSWSTSPDGLTYTFNLRQGVKFSDGKEFDASAVKYSFDRSLGLYIPTGAPAGLGYKDIIDSVEVTSKYQVVFHLKTTFAPFLSLLASSGAFIVNPKYAPMDKTVNYVEGNARASHPNDLGPYVLTSWTRKAGKDYEMRLDANPNYWGPPPKTSHIVFQFYSDATALAMAMKAGDIDIAYRQLTSTDIKSFESDPTVKVWRGKGNFIQYIAFQEKIQPFDNPKVRQAIAAALDRKEFVDTVFLGQGEPLYTLIPSGMAFQKEGFKVLGDANITLTVSILRELGYGP